MPDLFPHLDYSPKMLRRLDQGIGIIGAAAIVNVAHLPAYKSAEFKVVAITDKDHGRVAATAHNYARHGLDPYCTSSDPIHREPRSTLREALLRRFLNPNVHTVDESGRTLAWLLTDPAVADATGKYFEERQP